MKSHLTDIQKTISMSPDGFKLLHNMKYLKLTYEPFITMAIMLSTLAFCGCTDDLHWPSAKNFEYDIPTPIELNVTIGETAELTRAEMSGNTDKEISTLWIGFFDADDSSHPLKQWRLLGAQGIIGEHDFSKKIQLVGAEGSENAAIPSGRYVIAAVANPVGNFGIAIKSDGTATDRTGLAELLSDPDVVTDLNDFNNLVLTRGDGTIGVINTPSGNLPMQGIYVDTNTPGSLEYTGKSPKEISEYYAGCLDNVAVVEFTGTNDNVTLPGAIHFRRLISHNKFNIRYDSTKISEFEIVQVQVKNVPMYSWIAERADNADYVNAGDDPRLPNKAHSSEAEMYKTTAKYLSSPLILGNAVAKNTSSTTGEVFYSFDWWQLESRRYGRPDYDFSTSEWGITDKNVTPSKYSHREREYKNAEEAAYPGVNRNSGVYQMLSAQQSPADDGNCATFIEIRVNMKLKDNDHPYKMVESTYTVHLGYCEDKNDDEARARDFNCRRNTEYTYYINIHDADKIEIEANSNGEIQCGAEGTISNVSSTYFNADCHFCTYNIQLSHKEREKINWQIRYYDANSIGHDICLEPDAANKSTLKYNTAHKKYYQWIVLRPTESEDVIAEYKPLRKPEGAAGVLYDTYTQEEGYLKPFYLNEIRDTINYPGHPNGKGWYTMFIHEYVYEVYDEEGQWPDCWPGDYTTNWKDFVNIPARLVWLKTESQKSKDLESIVINSKYAVSQQSIQTFYDKAAASVSSAIGMENRNENDGLTNYYLSKQGHHSDWDSRWYALKRFKNDIDNEYDDQKNSYEMMQWSDFMNPNRLLTTSKGLQSVYALVYERGFVNSEGNQREEYRADVACINRNRDINGDGKINNNEVRWVVPDINLYEEFVIGSPSLQHPIFDFSKYKQGSATTIAHYNSCDQRMLWAEEGMSISVSAVGDQVRCVRFMGIDIRRNGKNLIAPAFKLSADHDMVTFNFTNEATRANVSNEIPWHYINSDLNKPPKKLEINREMIDLTQWYSEIGGVDLTDNNWFIALESYNPCDKYNNGQKVKWRVPNQTELATILLAGFFDGKDQYTGFKFYSCTREFFIQSRALGVTTSVATAGWGGVSGKGLICVRDVE